MLTAFRWLLRIFVGLVVLGLLAGLIFYYFLSRSLPDYDAAFTLDGISAPVEIVRNNNDVPHIFGKNDEDAFFCIRLCPCSGSVVADDHAAADRPRAAVRDFRPTILCSRREF